MDTIVEYGVDINSSWTFKDGDLELVDDADNLTQAIMNRLNTVVGSLDLFYGNYGSVISSFLGWKRTDETLDFIKLELDKCLNDDPRIDNFETSVNFDVDGSVKIDVNIIHSEGVVLDLNFVLGTDGVSSNEIDENISEVDE